MDIQLEIRVIKNFVVKEKQARYIQFISSEKNRRKFINKLCHFRDFKWNLFEEVNGNDTEILGHIRLFDTNIKDCHVISENSKIDQKRLSLQDAFLEIGRDLATILVFDNGDLIYFEGEPPKNRFIGRVNNRHP